MFTSLPLVKNKKMCFFTFFQPYLIDIFFPTSPAHKLIKFAAYFLISWPWQIGLWTFIATLYLYSRGEVDRAEHSWFICYIHFSKSLKSFELLKYSVIFVPRCFLYLQFYSLHLVLKYLIVQPSYKLNLSVHYYLLQNILQCKMLTSTIPSPTDNLKSSIF